MHQYYPRFSGPKNDVSYTPGQWPLLPILSTMLVVTFPFAESWACNTAQQQMHNGVNDLTRVIMQPCTNSRRKLQSLERKSNAQSMLPNAAILLFLYYIKRAQQAWHSRDWLPQTTCITVHKTCIKWRDCQTWTKSAYTHALWTVSDALINRLKAQKLILPSTGKNI